MSRITQDQSSDIDETELQSQPAERAQYSVIFLSIWTCLIADFLQKF